MKYLPVLAVLAATIIGLFAGKDLVPALLGSQTKSPTPIILGTVDPCVAIYLTLPPKCKALDGEFIAVPGTSATIYVTPV